MVAWDAVLGVAAITLAIGVLGGGIPLLRQFDGKTAVLARMTALAAGFLIASAAMVAIPEGFKLLNEAGHHVTIGGVAAPMVGGLAILAGFLFLFLLEVFGVSHGIHEEHHDHTEDSDHPHHPARGAIGQNGGTHLTWIVVVGLTLHAAMDGVALGAALASGSVALTISLVLAVSMHKLPAAFSMTAYSRHAGISRLRSMLDLTAFALATPVALVVVAAALAGIGEVWIGLALLVSAGTFLYVATVDVLPQAHDQDTGRRLWGWVIIGALVLAALLLGFDLAGIADPHGH